MRIQVSGSSETLLVIAKSKGASASQTQFLLFAGLSEGFMQYAQRQIYWIQLKTSPDENEQALQGM